MEICGHIILSKEIIGIGPLMVQPTTDQQMRALYNSKKLSFHLHLKNHSIKIESDWFDVGMSENDPGAPAAREAYKKFSNEYDVARKQVEYLIRQELVDMGPK